MNSYTYYSFYITCSFLVTTGTITFIEALRTQITPMRHILNLETCISIIAAYFYGKFISMLEPFKKVITEDIKYIDEDKIEKFEILKEKINTNKTF